MKKLKAFLRLFSPIYANYKSKSNLSFIFFIAAGVLELLGLLILIPITSIDATDSQSQQLLWILLFIAFLFLSTHVKRLSDSITLSLKHDMEVGERSKFVDFVSYASWRNVSGINQSEYNTILATEIPLAINCYAAYLQFWCASFIGLLMFIAVFVHEPIVGCMGLLIGVLAAIVARKESKNQREVQVRYVMEIRELNTLTASLGSELRTIKTSQSSVEWNKKVVQKILQTANTGFEMLMSPIRARWATELFGLLLIMATIVLGILRGNNLASSLVLIAIFYRLTPRLQVIQSSWIGLNQNLSWLKSWQKRRDNILFLSRNSIGEAHLISVAKIDLQSICLRNVSYRHKNDTHLTLDSIGLTISATEKIALVGPSGSGKSTLLDVLSGLLEPDEGEIYLKEKGGDTHPLLSSSLRIGYVTQVPVLIPGSIRENIGWLNRNLSEQQIDLAIERAGLSSFVAALSNGKETILNSSTLISGGQLQRIAIARAIVANPDLLLLDESTSGMDEELEREVINTLLELDTTVIITTHRKYATMVCDRVIELVDGLVTFDGSAMNYLVRK